MNLKVDTEVMLAEIVPVFPSVSYWLVRRFCAPMVAVSTTTLR